MRNDLYANAFFTDPEIIKFRNTFNPPPPVVRYKEHLRIYGKTKDYSENDILLIKTIIRIITKIMREFMCFSICQESTVDQRKEMYKFALKECRVNKRCIKFKYYKSERSKTMRNIFVIADASGITFGGAGGAILGGVVGGPIGAVVGGAGGALAGAIGGTIASAIFISNNFNKWKKKVDSDQFIQKLIEFHKDHEELKDFICIFSGDLIVDPVISKYGHTYERAWITQWITEKEQDLTDKSNPDWSITDPRRNGRLRVNDLRTDYGAIAKMQAIYSKILTDDIANEEVPKYIKEGLLAIRKDIDNQINHGLEIVEKQHFDDLLKRKISPRKFKKLEAERTRIKIALMDFIEM